MRYNLLGKTGLYVSELCVGAMTFGGSQGMWQTIGQLGEKESLSLVATALDAGLNFIDTADDWRKKAGATRRQPGSDRASPFERADCAARRGERATAGIPGLDGRISERARSAGHA
jgi:Aldo/keto reductase family